MDWVLCMFSSFLMYLKFGTRGDVYFLFYEVYVNDLMSWTLIIGVYARVGCFRDCLGLFFDMLEYDYIDLDGMIVIQMIVSLNL